MVKLTTVSNRLNIKWHGNFVVETRVKGKQTRKQIKKHVNDISQALKKKGFQGFISASLLTDYGWRSGYLTKIGDPISLYNPTDSSDDPANEQSHYSEYSYYLIKDSRPTKGGLNEYNDCLYLALKQAIPLNIPFKTGAQLKQFLGLHRNAKVDISLIPKIEEKLTTYKINVIGDHMYSSPKNCLKEINLKLINGHYTFNSEIKSYPYHVNFNEKPIMIYDILDNGMATTYQGTTKSLITKKVLGKHTKDFSSSHVWVKKEVKNTQSIEEYHAQFIKDAQTLKEESNGLINLFKTGSDYDTALSLFNKYTKTIFPDHIEQDEATWIQNTSMGAMITCEPYEGLAYKYDVCSQYPSILNSKYFLIPIKRGSFQLLDSIPTIPTFGIYRCIITSPNSKLFKVNKKNFYTHLEITRARQLGYDIQLIQDGSVNALVYSRDKLLNSNQLFGKYIEILFDLKKKKIPRAKNILNMIWGILCEKRTQIKYVEKELLEIDGDNDIKSIRPYHNGHYVDVYNRTKTYRYPFARFEPFILAKGRIEISKIYEPYINNIVRVHTDGFYCTKKIEYNNMGNELGQLKYEGFGQCKVVNNITVLFSEC
jgi:hypothetical protein